MVQRISDLTAGTPPYDADTLLLLSVPTGSPSTFASRKGTYGDLAGLVFLGKTTISSDVSFVDIDLPAGFGFFHLQSDAMTFDAEDILAGAFSADGGGTFSNDASNFDTYSHVTKGEQGGGNPFGNATTLDGAFTDGVVELSDGGGGGLSWVAIRATVFPGGGGHYPAIEYTCVSRQTNGGGFGRLDWFNGFVTLNQYATVAPATSRIDTIRILPYGNGDVDPPTSTHKLTSGSLYLWGAP